MSLETYTDLKAEVEDWLDSSSISGKVDTLIDLAEYRLRREFRCRELLCRDTIGVVGRYADLPDDFLDAKTLRLLTDPLQVLQHVNQETLNSVRQEEQGRPLYYTVHESIEFDVVPDQAYTGEMIYYSDFTSLSTDTETNRVLTAHPDAYFYATLSAAAPFLQDDERLPLWESLYNSVKQQVNIQQSKMVGTPISRVPGVLP